MSKKTTKMVAIVLAFVMILSFVATIAIYLVA